MCTISLTYDPNNATACRKLADLLATGLFRQTNVGSNTDSELLELEKRMDAYESGLMETVPQAEIYNRIMSTL